MEHTSAKRSFVKVGLVGLILCSFLSVKSARENLVFSVDYLFNNVTYEFIENLVGIEKRREHSSCLDYFSTKRDFDL